MNTQNRPPLSQTVQQFDATPMAEVLALQLVALTGDDTLAGDKDLVVGDASGGAFTVTLPALVDGRVEGKLYYVREIEGSNAITVDGNGPNIDGSATYVVAAGTSAAFFYDSETDSWYVVTSAATGVGTRRSQIALGRADMIGANAEVRYYVHSGADLTIDVLNTILAGVLTTGDATVTLAINGTPVTDGAATITQLGSGAGDIDSAVPSALNVLTDGDLLTATVGGTNDAAVFADVFVSGTY